jgi:hypothetical protein
MRFSSILLLVQHIPVAVFGPIRIAWNLVIDSLAGPESFVGDYIKHDCWSTDDCVPHQPLHSAHDATVLAQVLPVRLLTAPLEDEFG